MSYINHELVPATLAEVKPGEVFHFSYGGSITGGPRYLITADGNLYSFTMDTFGDIENEDRARSVLVYRPKPKVYFPEVGTVIQHNKGSVYTRVNEDVWLHVSPLGRLIHFTDGDMFYQNDPEATFTQIYPKP